jgi:hypothetical protein
MNAACEHSEAGSPAFNGHCSHASCPNYMDSCPRHENFGLSHRGPAEDRASKPCTIVTSDSTERQS